MPQPAEAAGCGFTTSPSYKWWVVFLLWLVCFLNYADRQAISSVLPLLGSEFHFDALQLGLIGSAFAWVYAAMAPAAGLLADRVARTRLIIRACILWSCFTLLTAWCSRLPMFLVARGLTGLGEAFYFPAAMALLSDYHSGRTRSRAMSWHQSAVYAGTILGSWLAAVLAERHGWHTPFLLFGPLGLVLALILTRFLREPQRGATAPGVGRDDFHVIPFFPRLWGRRGSRPYPGHKEGMAAVSGRAPSTLEALQLVARAPAAWLLMGAFLCANFVAVIFLTWTPTFLVQKFHYTVGAAGLTGTVYIHLASALAVPFAGWLADRLVRRWSSGRMLVQLGGLCAGAVFVFLISHSREAATLLLAMSGFGLCKGFYDSGIFASLYDVIEPHARGTAAGLMNTVGWAGGALGPVFVGLVCKYGGKPSPAENMSNALGLGAVAYLLAAALLGAGLVLHSKSSPRRT